MLVLPSVNAFEIKLNKQTLLQGETFLAEINAEFAEQLTVSNIFFYMNEKEIEPAFYLMQISKEKYFVWVDFSNTGNYSFAVKNILYKENGVLKGSDKEAEFKVIASVNSLHMLLQQDVKSKSWSSMPISENALSLLALAYDNELASQGKNALISKKIAEGCWNSYPSSSLPCTVKDTSLAIMSLDNINEETYNNWLIDSQNNLDTGLWSLQINSAAQQDCKLLINTAAQTLNLTQGTNTIDIDLKSKPETVNIKVNCSAESAKLIHTYLGMIKEFPLAVSSNEAVISLNNMKCFGTGYRSECDTEATAYAAMALNSIGADKSKAIEWLKKNAQNTMEKSVVLYLSSSSEIEDWLVNNQHLSGYFSSKSLFESPESDFKSTVFAAMALNKEKRTEAVKAEAWIKGNFANANLEDKALALAFLFPASEIEPIISINPAAIKATANTTAVIDMTNKAVLPVNITSEFLPFKTKQSISMKKSASVKVSFQVPIKIGRQEIANGTEGSIELSSKTSLASEIKSSIPVLIIIKEEAENETIDISESQFKFSAITINATIFAGDETLIPVSLKDLSHYVIRGITIAYSRDLKGILNITPEKIDFINPGEEVKINLTFKSNSIRNISGFIEAKSSSPDEVSARLPVGLSFTGNASAVSIKINTTYMEVIKKCSEMNGTSCGKNLACTKTIKSSDNERCCIGTCRSNINTAKIAGIALISLAVITIAVFLILGLRKPKKQAKDIYYDIEKKYSKQGRTIEPKG
ncbi:MAG: hypothetical protein V1886_04065 [archaeon]